MKTKPTCSTIFLVPVLGIGRERLKSAGLGFVSAYLLDAGQELQYEQSLYMLFKPTKMDLFYEFMEEERQRGAKILDDYDYEGGFVVVVYRLPDNFKEDYKKFHEGKYSKFSPELKKIYPKMAKVKDKDGIESAEFTLVYRVVNKTKDIIEFWENKFGVEFDDSMEVWDKPEIEKETLHIENIVNGPKKLENK